MNAKKGTAVIVFLLTGLMAGMIPARAGGPLLVTGPEATQPGKPYHWALNPIPYKTDLGGLGNQSNSEANSLVSAAFQVWQDVGTSSISFQNAGQLSYDVTANTVFSFLNAVSNCDDPSQPANAIVYDLDGSVTGALGLDNNSVLGFAGSICSDDVEGVYTRGWSVLNGRFIDGSANSPSHQTVTLDEFRATFIHEFGHLISSTIRR
jgi:hypothetical protein